MLTNGKVDKERLARLIALLAMLEVDQPENQAPEDVKARLIEFERSWHVRAFLAEQEILDRPPDKSPQFHASTFLDPIEGHFSQRLEIFNAGMGRQFRSIVRIRMDRKLFAQVSATGDESYEIEIGLGLIVQMFLGAITLSQSGSKISSSLTNPFPLKDGKYTAKFLESQQPLLQSINTSAFRHLLPSETWRKLLAYEIFSKALEFALLHEFAHAARGHLKFLISRGLPPSRAAENGINKGILPLTHQLLESQADDHAAQLIAYKWKLLTAQHAFEEYPLPLSPFGFCVANAADAHRVHAYAFTLLFFVLDAAGRGARISGIDNSPSLALYPTAAYRAWRALEWQEVAKVGCGDRLDCVNSVRKDLAEDRFPDANTVFLNELNPADIESRSKLLQDHAERHEEGRALMAQELARAHSAKPQRPPLPRRVWGEPTTAISRVASLIKRILHLFR